MSLAHDAGCERSFTLVSAVARVFEREDGKAFGDDRRPKLHSATFPASVCGAGIPATDMYFVLRLF